VAWRNAEGHLRRAVRNLDDARKLPGFAINGLAAEHARMLESLRIFAEEMTRAGDEARSVSQLLEAANNDYAANYEASRQEYLDLHNALRPEIQGRGARRADAVKAEQAAEAQRDRDVAPLLPTPPPVEPLTVVENWRTSGRGSY
jgi:hypothetical protein